MGWSAGYDTNWRRDIGYGVPAMCDHPGCTERIDRGLAHVCAGHTPYGGDGCGLYFCSQHQNWRGFCERCQRGLEPFDATPDLPEWVRWKLTDESWAQWRQENPGEVERLLQEVYDGRQSLMSVGLVYRIGHTLDHRPADSASHRENERE